VDLGGIDGLLHITDMSWGRISHPSELVKIGDKVRVKVLNFDPEKERISLGLKQLEPYPWEGVEDKYKVGDRVKGRVVSITDYGAFVELQKGVEGLIHVSEMSWTRHVRHPSKVVNIGDEIEAVVLKVDKANEKISLGLKQVEPDPWLTLDQKYPPGTKVRGKVRNLTNFGAFVELEEGIDGLVHVSDMSWTKRVAHPSEVLKKGDTVEVVVLSIDKEHRRISLGLKQVSDDPWPELAGQFPSGMEISGTINRLFDRGAIVDLGNGIEGFVPLSQLGIDDLKRPNDAFEVRRGAVDEGDASRRAESPPDPERQGVAVRSGRHLARRVDVQAESDAGEDRRQSTGGTRAEVREVEGRTASRRRVTAVRVTTGGRDERPPVVHCGALPDTGAPVCCGGHARRALLALARHRATRSDHGSCGADHARAGRQPAACAAQHRDVERPAARTRRSGVDARAAVLRTR
jgi:predicted RNA-binding protein with RPS1 domain